MHLQQFIATIRDIATPLIKSEMVMASSGTVSLHEAFDHKAAAERLEWLMSERFSNFLKDIENSLCRRIGVGYATPVSYLNYVDLANNENIDPFITCIDIGHPGHNIVVFLNFRDPNRIGITIPDIPGRPPIYYPRPYTREMIHDGLKIIGLDQIVKEWVRIYSLNSKQNPCIEEKKDAPDKDEYHYYTLSYENTYYVHACDFFLIKARSFDEAYEIFWRKRENDPSCSDHVKECVRDKFNMVHEEHEVAVTDFHAEPDKSTEPIPVNVPNLIRAYRSEMGEEITIKLINRLDEYTHIGGYEE